MFTLIARLLTLLVAALIVSPAHGQNEQVCAPAQILPLCFTPPSGATATMGSKEGALWFVSMRWDEGKMYGSMTLMRPIPGISLAQYMAGEYPNDIARYSGPYNPNVTALAPRTFVVDSGIHTILHHKFVFRAGDREKITSYAQYPGRDPAWIIVTMSNSGAYRPVVLPMESFLRSLTVPARVAQR